MPLNLTMMSSLYYPLLSLANADGNKNWRPHSPECYIQGLAFSQVSSVQFSHSVVSDSLRSHESQHARPPCPSPTPGFHSDSRPSSQWCHPAVSSFVVSFSNAWKWKVKGKSLSRVRLFVTPWTAAYQAPLSMGFSRQEYWSGMPLPSPTVCAIQYISHSIYYTVHITQHILYSIHYICYKGFSGVSVAACHSV